MGRNKILAGSLRDDFLDYSLEVVQKILFENNIRLILSRTEEIDKALEDIGTYYYELVPEL